MKWIFSFLILVLMSSIVFSDHTFVALTRRHYRVVYCVISILINKFPLKGNFIVPFTLIW